MAKSIQEYVDSLYNQGLNNANNLKEQRTQADEAFIKQVQDAIDKRHRFRREALSDADRTASFPVSEAGRHQCGARSW